MKHKNISKAKLLERAKISTTFQNWYQEYKTLYSPNIPNLKVVPFSYGAGTATAYIKKDKICNKSVELCVSDDVLSVYPLDAKTIAFHEFTHILDFFNLIKKSVVPERIHSDLSELHAAYVEMQCRLTLVPDENLTFETMIPVLKRHTTLKEYMISTEKDIQAFYNEAQTTQNSDAIVRLWKHLQYHCGRCAYLMELGMLPPERIGIKGIPDELFIPMIDCALRISQNNILICEPDNDIRNMIAIADRARNKLLFGN